MKNTVKVLGIGALVAVIGFATTGCLSVGNGGAGSSGTFATAGVAAAAEPADGYRYDSMPAIAWPSGDVWGRYGLSGLQQPPGTGEFVGQTSPGYFQVAALNANKAVFDNLVGQVRRMNAWLFLEEDADKDGSAAVFMGSAGQGVLIITYVISDGIVIISIN